MLPDRVSNPGPLTYESGKGTKVIKAKHIRMAMVYYKQLKKWTKLNPKINTNEINTCHVDERINFYKH